MLLRQFVAFTGIGIIATGLQYGILVATVTRLDMNPVMGSSIGYAVSAVVSYLLNYHFTFQSHNSHGVAAIRFVVVALSGLLLNGAVMALVGRVLHVPYLIAQLAATVIVLGWNFAGNALWSFSPDGHRSRNPTVPGGPA